VARCPTARLFAGTAKRIVAAMDLELEGKRALVTGSTAGIGIATARLLAAEGASVVAADVASVEDCDELIARVPRVDILVHNLGVESQSQFDDISDAEWFRLFETNVMSGVRLSRAYLPGMQGRNWGRIVFVSGESALRTAQLAVARGLAETTLGSGITVNSILPGYTDPEEVAAMVVYVCSSLASATNGASMRVDGGAVRAIA